MDFKNLPPEIVSAVSDIKHPAINFSLVELGIVKEIVVENRKAIVTFAFPFPNIPIKDALVNSIGSPIKDINYEFEYNIVLMTDDEKNNFLNLEGQGWKGL